MSARDMFFQMHFLCGSIITMGAVELRLFPTRESLMQHHAFLPGKDLPAVTALEDLSGRRFSLPSIGSPRPKDPRPCKHYKHVNHIKTTGESI